MNALGRTATIEITTRGRHEENEMGEQKPGEPGEFKVKSTLTNYRLDWDGETIIEIDRLNMVFMTGGVDRLAEQPAAILQAPPAKAFLRLRPPRPAPQARRLLPLAGLIHDRPDRRHVDRR